MKSEWEKKVFISVNVYLNMNWRRQIKYKFYIIFFLSFSLTRCYYYCCLWYKRRINASFWFELSSNKGRKTGNWDSKWKKSFKGEFVQRRIRKRFLSARGVKGRLRRVFISKFGRKIRFWSLNGEFRIVFLSKLDLSDFHLLEANRISANTISANSRSSLNFIIKWV